MELRHSSQSIIDGTLINLRVLKWNREYFVQKSGADRWEIPGVATATKTIGRRTRRRDPQDLRCSAGPRRGKGGKGWSPLDSWYVLPHTTITEDDQPFFRGFCLGVYSGKVRYSVWQTLGYFRPDGLNEGET